MATATDKAESTEVVTRDEAAQVMESGGRFDLAEVGDPTAGLETARRLVSYMAKKCTGPEYIAEIQGRKYPKVDWWTTVGGGLGLFPREESCRKLDRPNETVYEATVGVYNGDQLVTRASAICSDKESTWSGRDEYAIKSMAITRATGKAYRVGLSFLPVMAGLEPTPAEEMPREGADHSTPVLERHPPKGKHTDKTWAEIAEDHRGYLRWAAKDTDWLTDEDIQEIADYVNGGPAGEAEPSGAEPPSVSTSTETPAGKWLALWKDHRSDDTGERMRWEADVLADVFGDEAPLGENGLPDHAALNDAHYKALIDALMDEVEADSQTEAL